MMRLGSSFVAMVLASSAASSWWQDDMKCSVFFFVFCFSRIGRHALGCEVRAGLQDVVFSLRLPCLASCLLSTWRSKVLESGTPRRRRMLSPLSFFFFFPSRMVQ